MSKRKILGIVIAIFGLFMVAGSITQSIGAVAALSWALVVIAGLVLFFWDKFLKAKGTPRPETHQTQHELHYTSTLQSKLANKKLTWGLLAGLVIIVFLVGAGIVMMQFQNAINPQNMMNPQDMMGSIPQMPGMPGMNTEAIFKETPCDTTKKTRQITTRQYYEGPLIESHLHMPMVFDIPPAMASMFEKEHFGIAVFGKDVTIGELICSFDKANIKMAIGFYGIVSMPPMSDQTLSVIKEAKKRYPKRIMPFFMPAPFPTPDFDADKLDKILKANKGLFNGYGELPFAGFGFKGRSPNDSELLALYKIAGKHNRIVMIHPAPGQQAALEQAIQRNPDVAFLLHGVEEVDFVAILDKYKNAYLTLDTELLPGNLIYNAKSKVEFIERVKKNVDTLLTGALSEWKAAIESHPDQIMWGTDRSYNWHFDSEVGTLLEEYGRAFIGRIDPKVQEKFAYKNAEKLLQN